MYSYYCSHYLLSSASFPYCSSPTSFFSTFLSFCFVLRPLEFHQDQLCDYAIGNIHGRLVDSSVSTQLKAMTAPLPEYINSSVGRGWVA